MRLFSPEHLAAIAATAVLAVLLTVFARRTPGTALARALAIAILAGYAAEQVTYLVRGTWSVRVNLPLHLSDVVALVSIAALWRPRPGLATELVWFWALSASLQAVLTPDLNHTFPDVLYLTYFVTHSGAVAAACLLVIGMRLAPRPGAAWRAFGVTLAVAALAAAGCLITGGNYMFLRRKPDGSILDAMGPWPWYIAGGAALGLALLLVLQAIARALVPHERAR